MDLLLHGTSIAQPINEMIFSFHCLRPELFVRLTAPHQNCRKLN